MIASGIPGAGSGRASAGRYDLSALEVMVVDDSPYMLELVKLILRSMKIGEVQCHGHAGSALDAMAERPPDLIITDLLMAPLDGLELTRSVRLHDNRDLSFTPIFVLSGFTDMAHVIEARDSGAHEVLAKPISTERLYRRIISNIESPKRFIRASSYFGPERRERPRGPLEAAGGKPQADDEIAWLDGPEEQPASGLPGLHR